MTAKFQSVKLSRYKALILTDHVPHEVILAKLVLNGFNHDF
jgi:hypothetical protein